MTILHADTRDDPHQDWETTLSTRDGHPVFALIAVLFGMIVIGFAIGRIDTTGGILPAVAATLGPALVLWAIAYVVTIRHASRAWQLGTLGLVLLAAALYFVGMVGSASLAARRDVGMLAELRFDAQGLTVLPPDPDRGPASHVFVAHFTELNKIIRARHDLVVRTGMGRIADPRALRQEPALLRNCARFAAARVDTDASVARIAALAAALPGKLERAGIEPIVRGQLLDGMAAGRESAELRARAAGTRLNAMFEEAEALCTIFARRRWVARGSSLAFTDMNDLYAYDRHIVALNELIQEDAVAEGEARRFLETRQAAMRAGLN